MTSESTTSRYDYREKLEPWICSMCGATYKTIRAYFKHKRSGVTCIRTRRAQLIRDTL